jgi:hypothetical protein
MNAADRTRMLVPMGVGRHLMVAAPQTPSPTTIKFWEDLERAGFIVDRKGDIYVTLFERGGGHYVDVGASQKIIDRKVRLIN